MPGTWLKKWGEKSSVELPSLTRDRADDYPPLGRAPKIAERNRRMTEELREKVLPLIR
jgi:hypothetical protein